MNILKKYFSKFISLVEDFYLFGFYIAFMNFIMPILPNIPSYITSPLMRIKHKKVIKYLNSKYSQNIEYKNPKNINATENLPIWVCWLQGEENIPEVPKICIQSIKKKSKHHPVIFLTLKNYHKYVNIPDFIVKKFENKEISAAHFSDVIRTTLLADNGGCWIDSTVFMANDIDDEIFKYPFYSIKFKPSNFYITDNKWSNFFLVSQKNLFLFNFTKNFIYDYIRNEKKFIDYFLMDYIIYIAYNQFSEVKRQIDNIPLNNTETHYLETIINNPYDDDIYKNIVLNTSLFKLSWKSNKFVHKKNQLTFWGKIKKNINE